MHTINPPAAAADVFINAQVAGKVVRFMIDSGAQVNTITKTSFDEIMADNKSSSKIVALSPFSDKPLKAYASSGNINVVATFSAELFISEDRPVMIEKFYVVKEVRALLGFNTAIRYSVLDVGLNVPVRYTLPNLNAVVYESTSAVLARNEFPKFNIPPVTLKYDSELPPSRSVYTHIPPAFKELTKRKLGELLSSGIIEEVTPEMDRSFCSSLLVVPKGRNDIRLVIDLRGPNRCIHRTPFKMPTFESIVMELHGAKWFSTIDLKNAFFHIELAENSRHLTNFFAGDGLYRYKRLPFGLSNASDIFQESLQTIVLAGCEGVINYLDDILIFAKTKAEHDENLAKVKRCLENHNVRINEDKCEIGKQSVKFLGFVVSSTGWKIEDEKIVALKNFRSPENLAEVKSFLGLVNFVEKFIPHRAQRTWRLRHLAKSERFYWDSSLEEEFEFLKNDALKSITTLGYYNRYDETELYVDASPHGLGAVLVQFDKGMNPRIIACASKTLTTCEQKYPQTQREALAMVWGVQKFSIYLMCVPFTIRTDSEANEFIFGSSHRIGRRAVTRAETWALKLMPYRFTVKRIPGNLNLADALSRLMNRNTPAESFDNDVDENHLLFLLDSGSLEISWNEIETASEDDTDIIHVRSAIRTGHWESGLQRYQSEAKYLRTLGCLLFKSDRVVLPKSLRQKAIQSAHQGHMGTSSTKRIMREYFWWPGMSADVESYVKSCETCLLLSKKNPPIPLTNRELPRGPWEILQIDFFTDKEFGYGEFLVIVDLYSRYIHVIEMKHMTAESTIEALNKVFATWGYPLVIQSDNGPPFQSERFIKTWENKGISVQKSIPLSPQSNGAIERQNQGVKRALAASKLDNVNWRQALDQYVNVHNKVRPLSRLGVTPFELLVGWKYRGSFPCLWESKSPYDLDKEDIREKDAFSKQESKKYTDARRGAKQSDLTVGDKVVLTQFKRLKS
ncbi:uncharacterized protein K02A2.6-like [Uranotaenia lowii]|uniref:uncharacterized protein K02A2.6-like n=1 Tax=Uranotaenia lowii TaxID=190385 RepID=UPI0024791560|nr:uncharacterized protein K02A2.6-like [Uranotaenia lowii]